MRDLLRDLLRDPLAGGFVTRFGAIVVGFLETFGDLWKKCHDLPLCGAYILKMCAKCVQLLRNLFKMRHTIHYEMVL